MEVIISGKLCNIKISSSKLNETILGVLQDSTVTPLSYLFPYNHRTVSLRYFTDNSQIKNEIDGFMRLDGLMNCMFDVESSRIDYSEFTSESSVEVTNTIMIGGHDLSRELEQKVGQYLYLIVDYT